MRRRLLIWIVLSTIMTGCMGLSRDTLADTRWQLQSINAQDVPAEFIVTMEFTADTFGGQGFCNSYGGNYRLTNDQIVFSQTAMTMMACIGDNRDQREQEYMAALEKVATYRVETDVLTFVDATNQPVLQFVRAKP